MLIRLAYGYDSQIGFANWLGVNVNRFGNVERGYPLSSDLLMILNNRTGVSSDYLLFGREDLNPQALNVKLHAAEQRIAAVADASSLRRSATVRG
jgi:hypothetical protein